VLSYIKNFKIQMNKKDKKIGVGIVTCDRVNFFEKCLNSIPDYVDHIVVVNDGKDDINIDNKKNIKFIKNTKNVQVGECKNIAMRELLDSNCDYIFTLEDDIFIKEPDTFLKYINASNITGIEHFNFGFSQRENLDKNLKPVYRNVIEYTNDLKIVLTPNILGAFTFFTRKCLQTVGLHHHLFNKGHGDHPELTYRAYKHGFTTPFWWFADLYESWNMIGNSSNLGSDSLVRNQKEFAENFAQARNNFKLLHGVDMLSVPQTSSEDVIKILKNLKPKNG
jgi:GT2 family glycosyltransferase